MKKIFFLIIALTVLASCKRPDTNVEAYNDTYVEDDGIFCTKGLQLKDGPVTIQLDGVDTLFPKYDCLEVRYMYRVKPPRCNEDNYSCIHFPDMKCDSTQDALSIFGWNKELVFEEWNGGWVQKDPMDDFDNELLCWMDPIIEEITPQDPAEKRYRKVLLKIDSLIVDELKNKTFYYEEREWKYSKRFYSDTTRRVEIVWGRVRLR